MRDKEARILRYLVDNDSPKGCYALDIEEELGMKSGTAGPRLALLVRNGLAEVRPQDETPWPVSRRDATVIPGESPRRYYYRAMPRAGSALAERQQAAQSNNAGWSILNPVTA